MKTIKTATLLFCILPYVVAFTPSSSDTSLTTLEFAVGQGSYAVVSRDCSGKVTSVQDVPFKEVGGRVTHQISWFRFGLSAGYSSNMRQMVFGQYLALPDEHFTYVAPHLGINTNWFGLDAGYLCPMNARPDYELPGIYHSRSSNAGFPTAMLRLGNKDAWFLSASIANNLPLSAGGGLADVGLGFSGREPHSLYWIGIAASPYDGVALSLKGDFPLSSTFVLATRAQVASGDAFEYGLAVGGKIIF